MGEDGSRVSPVDPGRLGPYELLRPIARGAMGIVYRARHAESGEEVALKTLHVAEPSVLESLRREAHALSQIRHTGVVRMLGYGVEAGIPWYAMELIEGGTLAELWQKQAPSAERCAQSLLLIQRVCAPLAFLHGEGIVHRDLKPANIAVRRGEDRPVIVDFGLIGRWSPRLAREVLQAGGELIGTAHYIAPEQARGEYVDARADLYSLGCILYEAVTGRPPFAGGAAAVIMKHLDERPVPPSRHAVGLHPGLDQLILRLLEKDPRQRIGFADDVAAALRELTGAPEEPAAQHARSYLYRPSFVGRERTKASLGSVLDTVEGGHGACVLVAGESGSGKTRFAMETTRTAAARGFQVITGECVAVERAEAAPQVRGSPLVPLQPLLREVADRCVRGGPETTARILGRRAKVLSAYEPALRSTPGFDAQPEPAALPAAAERGRVLSDVADLLTVLSAEAPLLLVLDDLHWADDLTLALLESLGEGFFERARVLILGTFRVEEVAPSLGSLLRASHVERLDLHRLDRSEVGAMASTMLAVDPPRQLVRLLNRESEGNPFFVAEYLQAAVEAGFLHRSQGGNWQLEITDRTDDPLYGSLPLPGSLVELVERRLSHLQEPAASFVEAGAVLGREFDPELARHLLDYSEDEAMEALRQLFQRQLLEGVDGGGLRFAHDKLREAAYARIAEPRAVAFHRRAAASLEALHESAGGFATPYAELAHHWEMAGVKERAVYYLGLGGERALATGAYNDAHIMIARALALDDQMRGRSGAFRRAQWRRMLGMASFGIGDLAASIRHSADALTGLHERVPQSIAGWLRVATVELARTLLPRPADQNSPDRQNHMYEVAQACGQLATSYFYNADVIPAAANLLRGLNRAQRAGNDVIVVESCARLGYVSGALGLGFVARFLFRRAHTIAEHANDIRGRALALYLDAMFQEFLGHWENCRTLAEEAAAILEEIGDHPEAETARAIASHGYFYAGRFEEAKHCGAVILRAAEERSSKHHIGWGQFLIGRCDVVLGNFDGAITRLEEARVLLEPLPDALDIVMCEGWLARALLYVGRVDAAAEVATALGHRISGGRRPAVGQCVDGYAGWAEVALAVWERSRESSAARRAAQRACAELRGFARIFRMAAPAAARCSAHAQWLQGHRTRALRGWKKGVHAAHVLRMPYEEARSLADLGRATAGSDQSVHYSSESQRLFMQLGCRKPPETGIEPTQ